MTRMEMDCNLDITIFKKSLKWITSFLYFQRYSWIFFSVEALFTSSILLEHLHNKKKIKYLSKETQHFKMGTVILHYFENTSFQTNINYFLPRWKLKWIYLHFSWGEAFRNKLPGHPVHECVNYRFLSRHTWYLSKEFINLRRSSVSLFWSYLVCKCKSGVSVRSHPSVSHTIFKAFLVPSNLAVQRARVSPHQNLRWLTTVL